MARSIAVLKLSSKVGDVIAFARSVATALTDNPPFPAPTPSLATLQADVTALAQAESAVLSRTKGAFETRNARLAVVRTDLESLRAYVQSIVDTAPPAEAVALIEGAGFAVRGVPHYDKPALAAKRGEVSGMVKLMAKAVAARGSYFWEHSTDQKAWIELPPTTRAKTEVTGLTVGATYFFRVQALTKDGEGNFSQSVSLLVL
jgi:hypothetical protein